MTTRKDPLEGLRVSKPEDEAPPATTAAPEPPKTDDSKPKEKPKGKEEKPVVPPPVKPVKVPRYRVTAMKQISLRGQITVFKLGKIVSEETHGPGIVEYLKKAGVPLEEVKEE